jgi:hypothetical protein
MLDDDRTSVTTQSKWSISVFDKDNHTSSHTKLKRGSSRIFDQHNSPNTNHSIMEKSHLSENYFSLARKHEEMEDRLEEMLRKIEIEEYITRSSLKHVRYRLREQLVNIHILTSPIVP